MTEVIANADLLEIFGHFFGMFWFGWSTGYTWMYVKKFMEIST